PASTPSTSSRPTGGTEASPPRGRCGRPASTGIWWTSTRLPCRSTRAAWTTTRTASCDWSASEARPGDRRRSGGRWAHGLRRAGGHRARAGLHLRALLARRPGGGGRPGSPSDLPPAARPPELARPPDRAGGTPLEDPMTLRSLLARLAVIVRAI